MNRQEMIRRYAELQCCTIEQASDSIDTLVTIIYDGLKEDKRVALKYFGTFKLTHNKAHKGYDFAAKKSIDIPAHNRIKFIPCKAWRKEILREGLDDENN